MHLDLPTLSFVGLLMSISASIGFTSLLLVLRHQPALRMWVCSLWTTAFGITLIGMRNHIPDIVSIVIGNGAIAVGSALMLKGIAMHVGKPLQWHMPFVVVVLYTALITYFFLGMPDLRVRIALASIQAIVWDIWAGILLLRYGQREIRISCQLAASVMVLDASVFLIRLFMPMSDNAGQDLLKAGSPILATFVAAILIGLAGYFALLLLITDRLMVDLRRAASTDGLTGLLNRNAIIAEGQKSLTRCKHRGQPFALLIFDLDHFKQINDNWGHDAGDAVLQHFTTILREGIHRWPASLASRYGGEEFVLAMPNVDLVEAMALAEQLRHTLAHSPANTAERCIPITTSIGVAVEPDASFEQLVALADEALYRAKSIGRNAVTHALSATESIAPA